MAYNIFISVVLITVGLVVWLEYRRSLAKNEEGSSNNIYTELRKRASNPESHSSLSKYSTSELEIFKEQLRNVAYKKKLGHSLLPEEKELRRRFPNTYSIVKKSIRKKF
jgi:hypothetical protein